MKIARENGAWLSYDPNLRKPLWPSDDVARKEIFSIWDQADMIKVSCSSIFVDTSPI
jgi:fructokinase